MTQEPELVTKLNDFDPAVRSEALQQLAALPQQGLTGLPLERELANMHCHTFYSFNAYGHSPSSLAWLGRRQGHHLMGIVDFDVLDGVDEFLDACDAVGLRGSAGIETRVFIPEYAEQVINSPGEPGVCYHMGIGFVSGKVPAEVSGTLSGLRSQAALRNQAILQRVNGYLSPVAIDYHEDVLPLTPSGNPTERHMVSAYVNIAQRTLDNPAEFWADRLQVQSDEMPSIMADSPRFQNLIRAKLMKRGGVGYVPPESGMFPSLEDFHELIVACGALPCAAWLDGLTDAESDPETWLEFLVGKGIVALNIIPDRNWNISDPHLRRTKVENLYRIVQIAREMDLPLNIGTEMNSFGQKTVDELDSPELSPLRHAFLDGAYFVYGHTVMQRALGLGYMSDWARELLPTRGERNAFYSQAGRLIPPGKPGSDLLKRAKAETPAQLLSSMGAPA